MYVLRDAEFITNYPGIEADIEKLTYCSHFTEMIADIVQEAQPNQEAVDPFLYAVIRMNTANRRIMNPYGYFLSCVRFYHGVYSAARRLHCLP